MAVNARFWVRELTEFGNADNIKVTLAPVLRNGGDGNVDWAKFTPSGEITLFVSAEGAQEYFRSRVGKDIAITFSDPED